MNKSDGWFGLLLIVSLCFVGGQIGYCIGDDLKSFFAGANCGTGVSWYF